MGTRDSGGVYCDDCRAAEDATVHMHQNLRGGGVDICQPCLRVALEDLLITGPDQTFFGRLDTWVATVAARRGPHA
jgi:hypothetical protein